MSERLTDEELADFAAWWDKAVAPGRISISGSPPKPYGHIQLIEHQAVPRLLAEVTRLRTALVEANRRHAATERDSKEAVEQLAKAEAERDELRTRLAVIMSRCRTTEHEPPFDGLPCPMCDWRIRNLAATAHNLVVRWERWQRGGDRTVWWKIVDKMRDLRAAVDAVEPLSEAHFADRRHSHPEGG